MPPGAWGWCGNRGSAASEVVVLWRVFGKCEKSRDHSKIPPTYHGKIPQMFQQQTFFLCGVLGNFFVGFWGSLGYRGMWAKSLNHGGLHNPGGFAQWRIWFFRFCIEDYYRYDPAKYGNHDVAWNRILISQLVFYNATRFLVTDQLKSTGGGSRRSFVERTISY